RLRRQRRQELERDAGVVVAIERFVDLAHPAAPDAALDGESLGPLKIAVRRLPRSLRHRHQSPVRRLTISRISRAMTEDAQPLEPVDHVPMSREAGMIADELQDRRARGAEFSLLLEHAGEVEGDAIDVRRELDRAPIIADG